MNLIDHILLPQFAWLFLAIPILWLFDRRSEKRRFQKLRQLIGPRLKVLSPGFSERRVVWRRRFHLAGTTLLVLSLVAPSWGGGASSISSEAAAIMVVLDVSRSMLAEDASPNRLARAREEIRELISAMKGDRLGLIIFSGDAELWSPLTRDKMALQELLSLAEPSSLVRGGTNLGAAIDRAVLALADAEVGDKRIYLLTDGEDLEGLGQAAAARAANAGARVFCLGLGSELGAKVPLGQWGGRVEFLRNESGEEVLSRLDRRSLSALARAGDGRFQDAVPGSLQALDREVAGAFSMDSRSGSKRSIPANRYQWPLLLAILFFAAELSLVDRRQA